MTLKEDELERLVELSKQDFKCDNVNCIEYQKYNQCFNHSHVLCDLYKEFAQSKLGGKK